MKKKKRMVMMAVCVLLAAWVLAEGMGRTEIHAQQRTVVVGTNAEYAPFEYLDSDGNLTGFDYELLEAIAAEEEPVSYTHLTLPTIGG